MASMELRIDNILLLIVDPAHSIPFDGPSDQCHPCSCYTWLRSKDIWLNLLSGIEVLGHFTVSFSIVGAKLVSKWTPLLSIHFTYDDEPVVKMSPCFISLSDGEVFGRFSRLVRTVPQRFLMNWWIVSTPIVISVNWKSCLFKLCSLYHYFFPSTRVRLTHLVHIQYQKFICQCTHQIQTNNPLLHHTCTTIWSPLSMFIFYVCFIALWPLNFIICWSIDWVTILLSAFWNDSLVWFVTVCEPCHSYDCLSDCCSLLQKCKLRRISSNHVLGVIFLCK